MVKASCGCEFEFSLDNIVEFTQESETLKKVRHSKTQIELTYRPQIHNCLK